MLRQCATGRPAPCRLILALSFLFSLSSESNAADMSFYAEKPPEVTEYYLGGAYWVFASGTITANSGEELERFLRLNKVPRESHLAFNSPGGNVYGAMELGRVIRKWQLTVDIGERAGRPSPYRHSEVKRGYCYSACTIAYLGGYFRYNGSGSQYGVHRFSSRGFEGNEEIAQVVASSIASYIIEMGGDVKLLELSSSVSKNDLHILSATELSTLKIVNNGTLPVKWAYQNSGNVLYLKGERDTQNGIQKIIFGCTENPKELMSIMMFEAKQRERDIIQHQAEQLRLDDRIIDIRPYRLNKNIVVNEYIQYAYNLPKNVINAMLNAQEVSFLTKPKADSEIFFAFARLPFREGAEKLKPILSNCR